MKKKSNKIISAILAAMLVVTSIVTSGLITTSAATGDTVYCETDGFEPYRYMLIDSKTNNGSWLGVKMTKVKDNIYSYTLDNDYVNIIFNNGSDSKKTSDLIYPGDNTDPTSPTTTTPVPTTEPTTAPVPTTEPTTAPVPTTEPTTAPDTVMLGDAYGDNLITVADATLIQKSAVGLDTIVDKYIKAADVDGNGDINIKDATLIQKYNAEIEIEYNVGSAI